MSDTDKSKFVVFFDNTATPVNRRPNVTGEYRLAGEAATVKLAYWGGKSDKTGKLYARGKATPEGIREAIAASAAAQDIEAPPGIDLKVGESVIFENPRATGENKQPQFFGYAREPNRYVRLAGWERGNMIAGEATPYRPGAKGQDPEPPHPTTGG